jgi:hypothetical protein
MDTTNHKSLGFTASQPVHVQVRDTMDTIKALGDDLHKWNHSALKGVRYSGDIDVVNSKGDILDTAPKLALVVASSVFRQHLEANPTFECVEVKDLNIEEAVVTLLLNYVKTMVGNSTAKFGINISSSNVDLIKLRYAAIKLGMEMYVRHFIRAYKDDVCEHTPPADECVLLKRLCLGPNGDVVNAAGARLAYLHRVKQLNAAGIAALGTFLQGNANLRAAVTTADSRSHTRRT